MDIEYIINEVHSEIKNWHIDDQKEFFLGPYSGDTFHKYHHSLGRYIRNKFNLWSIPWEPEIHEDGCDYSPYHPDSVSMTIIKEVWKRGLQ
jgi:hypothetical protein